MRQTAVAYNADYRVFQQQKANAKKTSVMQCVRYF